MWPKTSGVECVCKLRDLSYVCQSLSMGSWGKNKNIKNQLALNIYIHLYVCYLINEIIFICEINIILPVTQYQSIYHPKIAEPFVYEWKLMVPCQPLTEWGRETFTIDFNANISTISYDRLHK